MLRAVVGFLLDPEGSRIVLIRKQRPAWQAGLLNGPGGKIEPGETPLEAVVREFHEETGVRVEEWRPLCVRRERESEVWFFTARGDVGACKTTTSEAVEVIPLAGLHREKIVYNLRWLLPLALHHETEDATWTINPRT